MWDGFVSSILLALNPLVILPVDEKLLRAWIVLSPSAREMIGEKGEKGRAEVIRLLDERCRESLCPTKWLTGGIEIVQKVCYF